MKPCAIVHVTIITLLTLVLLNLKCCGCETVNDIMTSLADAINITNVIPEEEFEHSKTVILLCRSNGKEHLFMFWQLPKDDLIVGPSNNFDTYKYDYEILSGNLTIRRISFEEEGIYHCVSKGVVSNDINVQPILVKIKTDSGASGKTGELTYFRVVVVLCTLLVLSGLVYIVYRLIKRRHKKETLLESVDDESYYGRYETPPRTSRQFDNIEFKRIDELEDDAIELPKISIDFEDILQNASK
ncbi:hypothetical protein PPYR_05146 [Photinus pyralis]|uniref:Ig-like domain-containing protein n=1 Tax=Photinus pyralis TaxID=7054 RepID=A0A1Y1KLX1_PHOPY|nr:uncharacterized protein LOC116163732 [Photinus pyralis]KAB0802960.1 hypothetical protein PPYR_05146 [Photinus pyralis]